MLASSTAERFELIADDSGESGWPDAGGDLLPGGQRLPGHAVAGAAAMFQNDEDSAHMTRTSNLSFSTSFAAASFGEPAMSLGLLFLFRQVDALERHGSAAAGGGRAAETRRSSFVFAFLMPISVA